MLSDIENSVVELLESIEIEPGTSAIIAEMGPEAVNILCEIAMGAQPGLRLKVRLNAVALLDKIDHEQTREALALLVNDTTEGVSIRAMRGAGRAKLTSVIGPLTRQLTDARTLPLLAAEAVMSLSAIGTADAISAISAYRENAKRLPHRDTTTVNAVFQRLDGE